MRILGVLSRLNFIKRCCILIRVSPCDLLTENDFSCFHAKKITLFIGFSDKTAVARILHECKLH